MRVYSSEPKGAAAKSASRRISSTRPRLALVMWQFSREGLSLQATASLPTGTIGRTSKDLSMALIASTYPVPVVR